MSYVLPESPDFSDEAAIAAAFEHAGSNLKLEYDAIGNAEDLERFRVRWVGKKAGLISKGIASWVKLVPSEMRGRFGTFFGALKASAEEYLEGAQARLASEHPISNRLGGEREGPRTSVASAGLDLSLPGIRRQVGVEHPLTRTMREMVAVFAALGYSVGVGPEVETDFYNFEALNFPPDHPARDTQDTLVVADQAGKPLRERLLMRTHTSPVQIRSMIAEAPPLRLVIPGKVHRNDESDATHSPIFHQVEGLCVDRGITFSDLKGTLDHAMKAFFGSSVRTRFFPSFFPFTEPSADVQISCPFCGGTGCRKCKHSGWIELLGCGMVDPAVFLAVDQRRMENGLEPAYHLPGISGFAFGMGVERIAMMKYSVGDIGQFYSGDIRFLRQFA